MELMITRGVTGRIAFVVPITTSITTITMLPIVKSFNETEQSVEVEVLVMSDRNMLQYVGYNGDDDHHWH